MLAGGGLIALSLLFLLRNLREDSRAGAAADAVMEVWEKEEAEETEGFSYAEEAPAPLEKMEIDGVSYDGYLSIPALSLKLPIAEKWNEEQLKVSPCTYSGHTAETGWVIAGHNYKRHFGNLKKLQIGDEIDFIAPNKEVYVYEVQEKEILDPYAVVEMTESDYPLTLYTCTYGGRERYTIRCSRKER